jgi:AraC family transcriptional regulator of adaptative response/methylated-DNA-[protein]-cysteine methyltransferase
MHTKAKLREKARATVANDPRWLALVARDPAADGSFFYSVSSTGVYCRPTCGARRPRPENVDFHTTAEAAEGAGFRPCRRCRPDEAALQQRQQALVVALCRHIETAVTPPTLAELARQAGLSPWHVHRLFKRVTGVTPKAYAAAHRAERVRAELRDSPTIVGAIYDAGYGSSGRFYAESHRILGMTPTRFRAGATDIAIRFAVGQCSLGEILVAQSDRGICAILIGDDSGPLVRELEQRFPRATLVGGDAEFGRCVAQVVDFVEAPRRGLDLPLDIRGTAFQQRVWQALRAIPAGSTISYSELACRIGAPAAVRAVAGACAANTLAVAIPCHRVVRSDGALAGYRWGVARKRALLAREVDG